MIFFLFWPVDLTKQDINNKKMGSIVMDNNLFKYINTIPTKSLCMKILSFAPNLQQFKKFVSKDSQWSLVQKGLHHHFPAASHRSPGRYLWGLLLHRWPCKIWRGSFQSQTGGTVHPETWQSTGSEQWSFGIWLAVSTVSRLPSYFMLLHNKTKGMHPVFLAVIQIQ